MSKKICLLAVVLLAAAVGLTPVASAQAHYIGVGSSAMFNGFSIASYNDLIIGKNLTAAPHCPAGHVCTGNHWSIGNNAAAPNAYCKDTRVSGGSSPVNQTGSLSISWVEDTTAGVALDAWVYLNVDSVVGTRCFLARPQASLVITAPNGTGGANAVSAPVGGVCPLFAGGQCDVAITTAVLNLLNQPAGIAFTAGMTDIRAEDGLLATQRILGSGNQCTGYGPFDTDTVFANSPCYYNFALGYNNAATPGIGLSIQSGEPGSGSFSQPVAFGLPGFNDPLSGNAVPGTIRTVAIGESPIIFVANRTNTGLGGHPAGLGQIIATYTPGGNSDPDTNGGVATPDNTGTPATYVSDNSYYVRNVWDQHPWPLVANTFPALGGQVIASDPNGENVPGGCASVGFSTPECHVTRRPLGNLFSGGDCEGDSSVFTWPLDPGGTQGLRATIPNKTIFPLTLFLREPLSGTYNTTEYTEMRRMGTPGGSFGSGSGNPIPGAGENPYPAGTTFERPPYISQELNIDPQLGGNQQALNLQCPTKAGASGNTQEGFRIRGIGTGQVVNGAANVANNGVLNTLDSLTYTFFSFGNISKIATKLQFGYLMVDAIDPLFDNYENATPGGAGHPVVTTANGGFVAPWGNGSGVFNVEGEPACEGTGVWPTAGCPFSLSYPATQEPGQPANNAANYGGAFVGPTGWGVLPACNNLGANQPICTAKAIWHSTVFGVDDSVNCPDGQPCTYPHLRDGSYPAWSELRLLCDTAVAGCTAATDPLGAEALVTNLQQDIHFSRTVVIGGNTYGYGVPDLLPFDFANNNAPYGDAYYIRDHYTYAQASDVDTFNFTGPFPNCANSTTHQSNVLVTYGGTAQCPNLNQPVNGPPTAECGGDAGGYVRQAVPSNFTPFYGTTGAYANGCSTTGFIGDLQ